MTKATIAIAISAGLLLLSGCGQASGEKGGQAASPAEARCISPDGQQRSLRIAGGRYQVGEERFYREEGPPVEVELSPFEIDAFEVTNADFAEFAEATGYRTRAERGLPEAEYDKWPDELRRPGSAVFVPPSPDAAPGPVRWWKFVEGADWRQPTGPGSSIEGKEDYPVVHITYEDAAAYAKWRGRRLPSEAEWEVAARGGLKSAPYAWGETPPDKLGFPAANHWQGVFPHVNQKTDGYAGLAPVGCFPPNGHGLYDAVGNVWEWTSDPYFPDRLSIDREGAQPGGFDPNQPEAEVGVIKGGSFLCAENYCLRFRPAARQAQELTLGASHIGFRTAADVGGE